MEVAREEGFVKTYVFRVVVEPDGDRWSAYCPALMEHAAATWGYTEEEALKNIQEVVEMVVAELSEDKEAIPEQHEDIIVYGEPRVAVTV